MKLRTLPIFLFAAAGLFACEDGAMEDAGESVDEAVEDTGDALDDAGDSVEDAVDDLDD